MRISCNKLEFSLQPNGVILWYFRLRLFDLTDYTIGCLQAKVAKILGSEK